MATPQLSIVTTMYKSAATIEEFVRRQIAAAEMITTSFEIVIVDDGSPDESLSIVLALLTHEPRLKIVELSRNFGHHRALMTGLMNASGAYCFLIDADLEEAPEWLNVFWEQLRASNADVVYGYQILRKGSMVKRLGGKLHWWAIGLLSSYPIPQNIVTARLMIAGYVRALVLHREQKTAIGGLWALTGFRQIGLPVTKHERGETSYSISARIALAVDGITSFSERPLMLVFLLGCFIFVLAVFAAVGLTALRLSGTLLSGWASVMVSIWMLGGLSIASIGILGLYIARIFIETKGRPYSIVRAVHNFASNTGQYGDTRSTGN